MGTSTVSMQNLLQCLQQPLVIQYGSRIEQDPVVLRSSNDRRVCLTKLLQESIGGFDVHCQHERGYAFLRKAASAYRGFGRNNVALAQRIAPRLGTKPEFLRREGDHPPDGDLPLRLILEIVEECGSDPCQAGFVRADGACQRMFLDPVN